MTDKAELLGAIHAYHEIGLAIIPFYIGIDGKKKPSIDTWRKWQTQPQTNAELQALIPKILETELFGIVTGTPINIDGETFYYQIIDRDIKDQKLSEETKAKSKQAVNLMRTTKTIRTLSGGDHLEYYSRTQSKGKKLNTIGMEFLATGNLCVMAPSKGYSKVNDNSPTVIENVEDMFFDAIEKTGLQTQRVTPATLKALETPKTHKRRNLRPCFIKLMEKTHLEHLEKVALVYELYFCGRNEQEIKDLFHEKQAWEPAPEHTYNMVETDEAITATLGYATKGEFRYKKDTLATLGICYATCDYIQEPDCRKTKNKQCDGINPIADIAKIIEKKYSFAVEKNTNLLYFYDPNEGIYTSKTEPLINTEICILLDDETRVKYYKDVDNWIRSNPKTPRVEFNTDNTIIAVKNGILHLDTKILENHGPQFYLTNKIPHDYIEGADCQPIKDFLAVSMPNENHRKQHQEFLGKIIGRENRHFHEYGIMQGEGNNGKSVLIDIDTFFLGKKNVSNQTLQALIYDKFATSLLKDKFANFCADLPSTMLKHMGIINMIAAGDEITSQGKYQDGYTWQPNLGMMFSCNEAPAIDPSEDHTGTYRRIMIWDFPIIFTPNDPDPTHREDKTLRDKLCTEALMSGYLNHVIEGLETLKSQGDFTAKLAVQETRKAYIKRSDSPHAFVMEKCTDTDNENDIVLADELFRLYIQYCVANRLTRRSKGELTKAIKNYSPGAEQTKAKAYDNKDAPRVHAWRFLKVSDLSDLTDHFPQVPKNISANKKLETFKNTSDNSDNSDKVPTPEHKLSVVTQESGLKTIKSRVCGDCTKHGLPCCSYPGDFNQVPKDHWAGECSGFSTEPQEMPNFEDKCEPKEAS
ncbi:MAG: phage/plasmid primase, P4 family [Sulfurimonas sp.]|jgi:putative DNA primase/helicase